ncbi:rhamnogalacturonan acetylesterase [Hufsiella ginkgonis]|uniref:GntR family transcriptional regulator n=1 Tax=Hufsiella ginkgonis TaxID=2695274 RepID=A0A7K1XUN0_9SPHI|nr:rhamnogalacturonan acetylesterase [Hufsiella ginkgonis]MXV14479.1 GntR family transcriptional regulator [Hufsiella ginkgonis]
MKKLNLLLGSLLGMLVLWAFAPAEDKLKIYLIGDSTMANKQLRALPETGWGMPFSNFFDGSVTVDNRAQNGRSTKSFMAENRWKPVVDSLQPGDIVLVQFGHNDEVKTKATYTTEEEFKAYLHKYVSDARSKKALPVLITPVARRNFDGNGKIAGTHEVYAEIVRTVARENNVPLIDLDQESQALLQSFGVENSKLLYNHLLPGEHPNYPDGKEDNTHFSELGARKMAQIVLADLVKLNVGNISAHVYKPPVKK